MSGVKINVLAAYPYMGDAVVELLRGLGDKGRFLLDSGAFTAWKQGSVIRLDDYCRFIEKLPITPWRYFTLDVIGDPVATRKNYEIMVSRGLKPIPIVTRGSELAEIDAYYETTDLVGLGGVTDSDKGSYGWVKAVMAHIGDRRAHILGFTSMDWLKFCRPYSADSSSWLTAARYGRAVIYLGQGKIFRYARSDMIKGEPPRWLMNRIRDLGFDPYAMQVAKNWKGHRSMMSQLSCTSWLAASIDMERAIGTLLFLAFANDLFLRNLIDAHAALSISHPEYA